MVTSIAHTLKATLNVENGVGEEHTVEDRRCLSCDFRLDELGTIAS
jgi:hypothetical protein